MKASIEFAPGDVIAIGDDVFTKISEAEVGQNVNPEIWTNQAGREFEPTLEFSQGLGEPAFNPLQE